MYEKEVMRNNWYVGSNRYNKIRHDKEDFKEELTYVLSTIQDKKEVIMIADFSGRTESKKM